MPSQAEAPAAIHQRKRGRLTSKRRSQGRSLVNEVITFVEPVFSRDSDRNEPSATPNPRQSPARPAAFGTRLCNASAKVDLHTPNPTTPIINGAKMQAVPRYSAR